MEVAQRAPKMYSRELHVMGLNSVWVELWMYGTSTSVIFEPQITIITGCAEEFIYTSIECFILSDSGK